MKHSLTRRLVVPLVGAAVLCTALAAPAEAQLGGLRRAVERRVEKKAEEKVEDRIAAATLIPPTFDATTIEITGDRLDRYIAAMETRKASLASNRQRYDAMQSQISAMREAAQKADIPAERRRFEDAENKYRECRSEVVSALEQESERQMTSITTRMQADPVGMQNDPKVRAIVSGMQALVAAQQSGDSAAVQRATARIQSLMGVVSDSASIDRRAATKCGARPAKPRSMVVSDSLSKRATAMTSDANALLSTSGGVKGAEVGMTDAQARMFWERIQSWLNGVQDSAPITRAFTRAEYDLLLARRAALRKAFANSE